MVLRIRTHTSYARYRKLPFICGQKICGNIFYMESDVAGQDPKERVFYNYLNFLSWSKQNFILKK